MRAHFDYFAITMTLVQAQGASHSGPCDGDVRALSREPLISRQLRKIAPADLRKVLREYGAWNQEELADHDQNLQRILWLAAGDIVEDRRG